MKTITIEIPEGKRAEWMDGVLTLVDEQPKDITERIKTFEDACEWCTENGHHNIRREYDCIVTDTLMLDEPTKDLIAYLKLRIITCALNEGWMPTFEKDEERWTVSQRAWESELTNGYHCDFFAYIIPASLYFKSEKLAEYAATRFKNLYMDFCYKGKE